MLGLLQLLLNQGVGVGEEGLGVLGVRVADCEVEADGVVAIVHRIKHDLSPLGQPAGRCRQAVRYGAAVARSREDVDTSRRSVERCEPVEAMCEARQ